MADRMIQCPECKGTRFAPIQSWNSRGICGLCIDSPGTIPDRRNPTASDRAVERIKETTAAIIDGVNPDDFTQGQFVLSTVIADIIREEAERNG